jgi:hypothetical protein
MKLTPKTYKQAILKVLALSKATPEQPLWCNYLSHLVDDQLYSKILKESPRKAITAKKLERGLRRLLTDKQQKITNNRIEQNHSRLLAAIQSLRRDGVIALHFQDPPAKQYIPFIPKKHYNIRLIDRRRRLQFLFSEDLLYVSLKAK